MEGNLDVLEELDYPHAPVVEVVLSVQFEKLLDLDSPRIGLYWSSVRGRFPFAEQHPPQPPIQEIFAPPESAPRALRIELTDAVPTPRFWLLNQDRSQLIQIQDDRFSHNWRKKVSPYPHYETVRDAFTDELVAFDGFLRDQGIGPLVPNQCEVTYINHVSIPPGRTTADIGDLLTTWSGRFNGEPQALPEDAFVHLRLRITGADDAPLGRVHVDLQPAFSHDVLRPIWVLSLTARGRPFSQDIPGAIAFLNLGREHVLRTFVGVTSSDRQEEWDRP